LRKQSSTNAMSSISSGTNAKMLQDKSRTSYQTIAILCAS
jgi:hypothetical protein